MDIDKEMEKTRKEILATKKTWLRNELVEYHAWLEYQRSDHENLETIGETVDKYIDSELLEKPGNDAFEVRDVV